MLDCVMQHCVIRTKHELEDLFQALRGVELPMKVYYQRILPHSTPDQMAYLWGVIYKEVGNYMGEADIKKVHEKMLEKFNIEYSPLPHNPMQWALRIKRGSEWNIVEIGEYIEKVCAYVATEFGGNISLPHPTEVWANK